MAVALLNEMLTGKSGINFPLASLGTIASLESASGDKALADAASSLGRVGGDKALLLLEKILTDQDAVVRMGVVGGLCWVGKDKALAMVERLLSDQDVKVRSNTARCLVYLCGNKASALIEKALADSRLEVRSSALHSVGYGALTSLTMRVRQQCQARHLSRNILCPAVGTYGRMQWSTHD